MAGDIRIGIGGWTFEPWRGVFYPPTLKQKDELNYASRQLTAIEINGTYYSSFKPDSWKKWRDETPDGFVFTIKGSRFTTNRRELAGAGESLEKFFGQGIEHLGDRLGPIFWQFANSKKFDPADFEGFLKLLPRSLGGRPLRHAVEVRHDSFCTPAFPALLREHGVAVVYAKHNTYPEIADLTADFAYARLQTGSDACETAYEPPALDAWAKVLKTWAAGGAPADLPVVDPAHKPAETPRDVFAFIIHEGKVRAPAGAMALIERVK
ncbi:DUF72 domain-containing protein [Caulobacter sp. KR2-114]|uniref:DUF72 domain-containing protein n=1 Tax=Caulobacter sp. KR2-114 TaxID=3400912 RepID=UPI003C0ED2DA